MQPKKRPPKKTAMLEVRVSPQDKADFLSACLESGQSASTVIRKAMRTHARRIRERPGRLKMTMTMMVMLPFLGILGPAQPVSHTGPAQPVSQTGPVVSERSVCRGEAIQWAPSWPVAESGHAVPPPDEPIRIVLRFDRTEWGRATNIRAEAPEGYDAFVDASIAALLGWCLPQGEPLEDQETAFDFQLSPGAE